MRGGWFICLFIACGAFLSYILSIIYTVHVCLCWSINMIISRDGTFIHTRSDISTESQSNDISSRNQIIIGVVVGGVAFIASTLLSIALKSINQSTDQYTVLTNNSNSRNNALRAHPQKKTRPPAQTRPAPATPPPAHPSSLQSHLHHPPLSRAIR